MDPAQQERFEELLAEWSQEITVGPAERARLAMLACIEIEMHKLQRHVNRYGPTYQVRGKSGDTYSRARPEYQQLQDARQRYGVLLDKLAGQNSSNDAGGFIAP